MSRETTDRITVYVDTKEVQRRIKQLELNHDVVLNAQKRDIHQAIFNVAFDHSDEVVAEIRRLRAGDDDGE